MSIIKKNNTIHFNLTLAIQTVPPFVGAVTFIRTLVDVSNLKVMLVKCLSSGVTDTAPGTGFQATLSCHVSIFKVQSPVCLK